MNFTISQPSLYATLAMIYTAVETRATLPILANVLLSTSGDLLTVTATDLEIEQVSQTLLESSESDGSITLPARKLMDIVKSMPKDKSIDIKITGTDAEVKCGRSRYKLTTIPASDFPDLDDSLNVSHSFFVASKELGDLFSNATFAMANQDVRYFLNGAYVAVSDGNLEVVSTDGHRLATKTLAINTGNISDTGIIIPRKGVLSLQKLLNSINGEVKVEICQNHFRLTSGNDIFTTKLVDGKYPQYKKVIPTDSPQDVRVVVNTQTLKSILSRVTILANEKTKGVRLVFSPEGVTLMANNPEQEHSEEHIDAEFTGNGFEIGVNSAYLMDVLSHNSTEDIIMILRDSNSTIRLLPSDESALCCIMPMRL